jgi:hypothetical protein
MESEQDKKLINELKAMEKVNAPYDFLNQVNDRLEKKPATFGFPLKLATAGAAFLVIFSIYVLMQPEYQMAFKAPGTKVEKEAKESLASRTKKKATRSVARRSAVPVKVAKVAAPVKPKPAPAKPAEMALVVEAEEDSMMMGAGAAPSVPVMDVAAGSAGTMRSVGFSSRRIEPPKPSSFEKVKYIISLVDGKVVDSSSEYISADIPAEKQESFLKMIGQFDDVEKPSPVETDKETVRLRIKLLPKN